MTPWLYARCFGALKSSFLPSYSYFFNAFFYYFGTLKALPGTSIAVRMGLVMETVAQGWARVYWDNKLTSSEEKSKTCLVFLQKCS